MSKHFKKPATHVPDFIIVSGIDPEHVYQCGPGELVKDRKTAFGFDNFDNAVVLRICLDDGTARDETEDTAIAWWERWGEPDAEVPAIFAKHLTDEIEAVAHRDIAADRADAYREGMRA